MGVTSVIRCLGLDGRCYESMIRFFRSTGWDLDKLTERWCQVVKKYAPLERMNGRIKLIGDGVKKDKEGRYMPGVKRLVQESETVSKPQYIHGHLFGGGGALIEVGTKRFCIPLNMRVQDGVKEIFQWEDEIRRQGSHVEEMIVLLSQVAQYTEENAYILLDAYFLSTNALKKIADQNKKEKYNIQMVTRAKISSKAYHKPLPRKPGQRGATPKKGQEVKLQKLFETETFTEAEVQFYDGVKQIKYYSVDLLWGPKLYQELRFVLTIVGDNRIILVSTDLSLDPISIVELYCQRFKIEQLFKEAKQTVFGFSYHFWTKAMPKLNHFRKKTDPDPLTQVKDKKARDKVSRTLKAIEGYVQLSCIAIGLLQIISLKFFDHAESVSMRWMRTYRNPVWSEATVNDFLKLHIIHLLDLCPDLPITQIIQSKQNYAKRLKDPPELQNTA